MRKLLLLSLLGLLLAGEARAWVVIEDDNDNTWECDSRYCYREGDRRDRDAFEEWMMADDKGRKAGTRETGDPLAMPKRNGAAKDSFAQPKKNGKDLMAF